MKSIYAWAYAIAFNVIVSCVYLSSDSFTNDIYKIQLLVYPIILMIVNLFIGKAINLYNASIGFDENGKPFYLLGIIVLLIGWGICTYK
jgi:hypothetical protein